MKTYNKQADVFRISYIKLHKQKRVDGWTSIFVNFFFPCDMFYDRLRRRELHLPAVLEPESIFQAELESFLGNKTASQDCIDKDADKSLSG